MSWTEKQIFPLVTKVPCKAIGLFISRGKEQKEIGSLIFLLCFEIASLYRKNKYEKKMKKIKKKLEGLLCTNKKKNIQV